MTQRLVTEVRIMPADLTLYEGEEMDYTEDVQPAEADDKELTWTSSDPTVATIAAGGHVKALKAGTTTITATADDGSGAYGQARITVRPKAEAAERKATGIVVDQKKCILKEKATTMLTARVLPVTAADKGFRWSSSDPRVASVNSDGVVTAHLPGGTALDSGYGRRWRLDGLLRHQGRGHLRAADSERLHVRAGREPRAPSNDAAVGFAHDEELQLE